MEEQKRLESFLRLDQELVSLAKGIKILTKLAWPATVSRQFLDDWRRGQPRLPDAPLPKITYKTEREALEGLMKRCDQQHPLGAYLFQTAASYVTAAWMLECAGTAAFSELSAKIYGLPESPSAGHLMTNLETAEHFIAVTEDYVAAVKESNSDYCVLPGTVAAQLQREVDQFFGENKVTITIDPSMASKAAAGAYKIRVRGDTCFSEMDIPQLLHHEAFVHTLTLLNGREQPHLKSLGLGAPRTTRTQEGLAILAELVTDSLDLNRLRRIALRVKAIAIALKGGDFIEVFKFFLEAGQTEQESFNSAMRVFRGGDVRGGVAFTKDVVYLPGLVFVHTFLLKAIQRGKLDYIDYLFSGRLTMGDVVALEPYFKSGLIAPPHFRPEWTTNPAVLVTFLLYSIFATRISLGRIELEEFIDE